MRNLILLELIVFTYLVTSAQGWTYSTEFGTDFQSTYNVHGEEYVNCNTGRRSVQSIALCMRRDFMNVSSLEEFVYLTDINQTYSGLEARVASAIAAHKPHRNVSTSTTSLDKTQNTSTRRRSKNYNYQTSDTHLTWLNDMKEAREAAAEKKRQEELARKIADNQHAAEVTAHTNSLLQPHTNRKIQSDHYNANEGAHNAQQLAHKAARRVGPQFNATKQMTTAEYKEGLLRRQNKPRRIMYPTRKPQNTARPQLAQIERKESDTAKSTLMREALMKREVLRRQQKAKQHYNASKGIKLTDNSVSTLGKDWYSDDFKPVIIPPITKKYTLTPEDRHILICKEMLEVKLTPAEELRYQQIVKILDES